MGLFDTVLELKPSKSEIRIMALKGGKAETADTDLRLDPATMLINTLKS